jgi:hypothetical protein
MDERQHEWSKCLHLARRRPIRDEIFTNLSSSHSAHQLVHPKPIDAINKQSSGQFKDDNVNGKGTYYFANGKKYTGEWMNDRRNGHGVFTWLDGERYMGQFKNGKMNGKGTRFFKNGNNYTGEWMNDSMNGQGIYTWPDGHRYVIRCSQISRHYIYYVE